MPMIAITTRSSISVKPGRFNPETVITPPSSTPGHSRKRIGGIPFSIGHHRHSVKRIVLLFGISFPVRSRKALDQETVVTLPSSTPGGLSLKGGTTDASPLYPEPLQ